MIAETNALDQVTLYHFETDTQGQTIKTTTYPDGGTRIETIARDGTLLSLTGTMVSPVRYVYGVEMDEGRGREFIQTIKLDATGQDTAEWIKAYKDLLGRVYKTVYPNGAMARSWYNPSGKLWKTQDPDGVVRLTAYNGRGQVEYSALDLNRNDRIDFAENDRITRSVLDVTVREGWTVKRNRTWVWDKEAKNEPLLVSTQEQAVNGLVSWQQNQGLTQTTQTRLEGRGVRVVEQTAPDQSRTVSRYEGSRLVSQLRLDSHGRQLMGTKVGYDAHGRRQTVTDARNSTTTYRYNDLDRVISVTTPAPADSEAPQTTVTEYDAMGRPVKNTQPDGASVFKEYYPSGQLRRTYGARTYPVEYTYDAQGRMKTMTTYQDYAKRQGAAMKTWNYDPKRGFLQSKRYADGQGPEYEYYASGKIKSRKWARGIVTQYRYSPAGELAEVSYSDTTTPKVQYTYDRQGRRISIDQLSIGTRNTTALANSVALGYSPVGQLLTETYTAGPLAGVTIANTYDTLGRRTTLAASHASRSTSHAFAYDDASRLKTVSDGENTATYDYLANSPLWGQISFEHNGVKQMTTTRQFDRLNRLKSISSSGGASSESPIISAFDYQYNQANQRVKAALEDESYWDYTYDSLGQLTSGKKQRPNRTPEPDQDFEYAHDDIGNRIVTGGRESFSARYAANALNQYTRRDDLQTAGKTTGFQYDADGNLVGDDQWTYTWDAENRLLAMESAPGIPSGQRKRLEFTYDSQSRRIGKKVYELQGNRWSPITELRFVYDGWNLLAELSTDHRPLSTYLWGLDLSGSLQGAGGVGGLLMATERGGSVSQRYMAYDGNGNVVGLVDGHSGVLADRYAYDPFGNELESSNHRSIRNPFGFSTKYHDEETGLSYYGFRYYQPASGRWLSRDPILEKGGRNIYVFTKNNPTGNYDVLGLFWPFNCGKCGPDVTDAVSRTLEDVESTFLDDNNPKFQAPAGFIGPPTPPDIYRRNSCMALYKEIPGLASPGMAWDIYFLSKLGERAAFNSDELPSGIATSDLAVGPCKGTVVYNGQCVWGGALNYLLFGKINKLCSDKFSNNPFPVEISGSVFGVEYTVIHGVSWSLTDVYLAITYHKLGASGGLFLNNEAIAAYDFGEEGYSGNNPGSSTHGPHCSVSGVTGCSNTPLRWQWTGIHTAH